MHVNQWRQTLKILHYICVYHIPELSLNKMKTIRPMKHNSNHSFRLHCYISTPFVSKRHSSSIAIINVLCRLSKPSLRATVWIYLLFKSCIRQLGHTGSPADYWYPQYMPLLQQTYLLQTDWLAAFCLYPSAFCRLKTLYQTPGATCTALMCGTNPWEWAQL